MWQVSDDCYGFGSDRASLSAVRFDFCRDCVESPPFAFRAPPAAFSCWPLSLRSKIRRMIVTSLLHLFVTHNLLHICYIT